MSGVSDGVDLRVICGPTGAGKSAVALWLARRYRCAIINADSRQVYRGFDIGTSKPTPGDRAAVPHYGLDVVPPTERYSAAAWAGAAARWIEEARTKGLTPLIVGGTGLYIRALIAGVSPEPTRDPVRRAALERFLGDLDTPQLRRWATVLDPARASLGRTQLIRAIEVAVLGGIRISAVFAADVQRPPWRPDYLVVDRGAVLAARNIERTDAMIAAGWADEVAGLMETVPAEAPAWTSTGYGQVRRYVSGSLALADARDAIIIETRQYAKRQRTWFRHQLAPERVTLVNVENEGWRERVDQWWTSLAAVGE